MRLNNISLRAVKYLIVADRKVIKILCDGYLAQSKENQINHVLWPNVS